MREYAHQQAQVLLRRLAYQISRAAKSGDADAVHDLRVAIRRLSRCLRTFASFFPQRAEKKVRHRLARLLAAAGEVRDLDIALALLKDTGVAKSSAVVKRLNSDRSKASHQLHDEVRRWSGREVSRKWRAALEL